MPPFPQTPWSFQLREHVCRAAAGYRCRVGGSVAAVRSGRAVLRVAILVRSYHLIAYFEPSQATSTVGTPTIVVTSGRGACAPICSGVCTSGSRRIQTSAPSAYAPSSTSRSSLRTHPRTAVGSISYS
eukprot:1065973-Prorocentrum_minimum.AAC.1